MNAKGFLGLAVVTAGLIAGAIALTPPAVTVRAAPGERWFPNFDAKTLASATSLEITHKGKTVVIERKDDAWTVKDLGGYPAKTDMVVKALTALTELRPYESKTNDAKRLEKLELDDPAKKDATGSGKRLTVKDGAGKVLADVVFGKSNTTNVILGKEMVYVRRPDQNQAWLAEGDPSLKADAIDWAVRDMMDVKADRLKAIETKDAKDAVVIALNRADPDKKDWSVAGVPEGRKLKEQRTINYMAEVFETLAFEDVKKEGDIDWAKNAAGTNVYRSHDGLVITVRLADQDKKIWAAYKVEADEAALLKEKPKSASPLKDAEAVKKEAAEIAKRLAGWAYVVSSTNVRFMQYKLEDLLEEVKKDEKK